MSNEEFLAVKHFAEGLKTCIGIRQNSLTSETAEAAFEYIKSLISLHLALKETEFDAVGRDIEETFKRA